MSGNLGDTRLRRKRRAADPMQAYDALPARLRHWLANAALPWSPASVKKVWLRALREGLAADDALRVLDRCEAATLQSVRSGDWVGPRPEPPR